MQPDHPLQRLTLNFNPREFTTATGRARHSRSARSSARQALQRAQAAPMAIGTHFIVEPSFRHELVMRCRADQRQWPSDLIPPSTPRTTVELIRRPYRIVRPHRFHDRDPHAPSCRLAWPYRELAWVVPSRPAGDKARSVTSRVSLRGRAEEQPTLQYGGHPGEPGAVPFVVAVHRRRPTGLVLVTSARASGHAPDQRRCR